MLIWNIVVCMCVCVGTICDTLKSMNAGLWGSHTAIGVYVCVCVSVF